MAKYTEDFIINGRPIPNMSELASGAVAATITAKVNALLNALISANLMCKAFTVSYDLENVTETSQPTEAHPDTAFSATIAAESGKVLPDAIEIYMSGEKIPAADYTYTRANGTISIVAAKLTGDITIVAVGGWGVTQTLSNATSSNAATCVREDEKFETTLTAASGYTLPSTITVSLGGTTQTAGTGYTYDATTGELTIGKVTGAVVITCTATN